MTAIAVYVRISLDTEGLGLGVARQEEDCRELVVRRGWDVAYVASDNDISAYKKVVRPEFERVLDDLASGAVDGLAVYDLDRLARQPRDLERLIDIFDSRPLSFAAVTQDIDLSTSDGRFIARLMVSFANKSSADTSRRVTRKHRELALKGVAVGGNRAFGWKADRVTPEPEEVALCQEAAKDILSGVGLHTIARRWNEQGIRSSLGNLWQRQTIRQMFLSPRIAGFRVYQNELARDNEGNPVVGNYPPVLDVETWEAVCAVISDPGRSGKFAHVGGRKYLLSGVMRCGVCSKPLNGSANARANTFVYACKRRESCGKVAISGPQSDDLVTRLVMAYLADQTVQPEVGAWNGEAELARADESIAELMAAYTQGELTRDVVFPSVGKLEDQAATLRDERSVWLRTQTSLTQRPTNVVESWPRLDMDQRRQVIASVLHSVVVAPAKGRGGRYDPERLSPVWQ